MEWLLNNPLANMYGPHFLIVYAGFIAMLLVVYYLLARRLDTSAQLAPLMPSGQDVDPFEVAYLRGGENEVVRLAVFELMHRGFIHIEKQKTGILSKEDVFVRTESGSDPSALSPLAQTALDWFTTPRKPAEVFDKSPLPTLALEYCEGFKQREEEESLLLSDAAKSEAVSLACWVGAAIVLFGGYKLVAAIMHGHFNVGFLVGMAIAGIVVLAMITPRRRLSRRGRTYLASLQQQHNELKAPACENYDPLWLSAVGLFGVSVLAGSVYSPFGDMFKKSAAAGGCSASGCGSSGCGGASGCGGGGGGGGCGGCGGGD